MPYEWKRHDERWMVCQKQLTKNRWLLMFYQHLDTPSYPGAWANILSAEWIPGTARSNGITLRCEELPYPAGLLEVTCVGMEWEKEVLNGTL